MTIRKLLSRKGAFVPTIRPDARVADAIEQLELDDAGALVVTDDGRSIRGILSERDIVRFLRQRPCEELMRLPVGALMHRVVYTCDIAEPMTAAYELMNRCRIRHVPVTENGALCGIVTMLDVVKYLLDEVRLEADSLRDYVLRQA
ncbi:MAG TPA: CBS domain-containing protein [Ferrovibrio sp.]|uniref:CBS domain-containing protein n=1 Tax=Ferrovibrio sp. TaxID=1917215 RepID=UPI002B4B2962|nr:CBS domain-containing protein [Ferrovibrio sp.]HLT76401.1 CBS domain-containing protein [Ferrovibrio sp.]